MANGSIQTILSGDELDMFRQTANTLPALYEQREWAAQASVRYVKRPDMMAGYQEYLYCHYADRGNVHGLYLLMP